VKSKSNSGDGCRNNAIPWIVESSAAHS
jgi:hypothetical protein